jgi:hypothetical protein
VRESVGTGRGYRTVRVPVRLTASRAARTGLAVLTLINLLNYLDRYVVASLVESLKKSELSLSDAQAGSLMTGFVIVYMLTSPFFGRLGDLRRRPPLLALGVGIWSVATALGGLARSFGDLGRKEEAIREGQRGVSPSSVSSPVSSSKNSTAGRDPVPGRCTAGSTPPSQLFGQTVGIESPSPSSDDPFRRDPSRPLRGSLADWRGRDG